MVADQGLVEGRAESLAIVFLTRRDDLDVARQPSSQGSLLVTLHDRGRPTERVFGAEIFGALSGSERASRLTQRQESYLQSVPFPVCGILFLADTSQGYWRWLCEPAPERAANMDLTFHAQGDWKPLTVAAFDQVISQVNRWYDARK